MCYFLFSSFDDRSSKISHSTGEQWVLIKSHSMLLGSNLWWSGKGAPKPCWQRQSPPSPKQLERLWRWREGWAWGSLSVEVKDSNGGWGLFDVSAASSSDFWNRYAFAMGVLSHVASSVVYVGGGLECISAWTGKGWGAGWKIATLAPFWELFQFAFS